MELRPAVELLFIFLVCFYYDTIVNYPVTHWFISTALSFISMLDKFYSGKKHYFTYCLMFSGYFHILLLHTVQTCSEDKSAAFLRRFIWLSSVQCLSDTLTLAYPPSIALTSVQSVGSSVWHCFFSVITIT